MKQEQEIDLFIFNAISNPNNKMFQIGSAAVAAGGLTYVASLGEFFTAEWLGKASADSLVQTYGTDISLEKVQRIRAMEVDRIHSKMPLNAASTAVNENLQKMEFTLIKHGAASKTGDLQNNPVKEVELKKFNIKDDLVESGSKKTIPAPTPNKSK